MPTSKPVPPKGQGRRPGTKLAYKPQSEGEKAKRVAIPTAPTISRGEDKAAHEAQQTARVELLLLKGISSPRVLGQLLGIEPEREVNRLVALVHARWSVTGSGRDVQRARGESLARLQMLSAEVWAKLSDNDASVKPSDVTARMKLLLEISAQQDQIAGLAPRIIERMSLLPQADDGITSRLHAQAGLAAAANRFMEIMASRREKLGLPRTIEHDAGADLDFTEGSENTTAH